MFAHCVRLCSSKTFLQTKQDDPHRWPSQGNHCFRLFRFLNILTNLCCWQSKPVIWSLGGCFVRELHRSENFPIYSVQFRLSQLLLPVLRWRKCCLCTHIRVSQRLNTNHSLFNLLAASLYYEFIPGCYFWINGTGNAQWRVWCVLFRLTSILQLIVILGFLLYRLKVRGTLHRQVPFGWRNQVFWCFSQLTR